MPTDRPDRTPRPISADLLVWSGLAIGALVLVLLAFVSWDRPVDPPPADATTTSVATTTSSTAGVSGAP